MRLFRYLSHNTPSARQGSLASLANLSNDFQFVGKPRLKVFENVLEHRVGDGEGLHVVLVDLHFKVEASELAQVPPCVAIFCPENWANLKNSVEVGRDCHLLVELGRLGEASFLPKVICCKNARAALALARNEFGSVNFHEILRIERFAKQLADARLNLHYCVVGRHSEVDPAVVEAQFLAEPREGSVGGLRLFDFCVCVCVWVDVWMCGVGGEEGRGGQRRGKEGRERLSVNKEKWNGRKEKKTHLAHSYSLRQSQREELQEPCQLRELV